MCGLQLPNDVAVHDQFTHLKDLDLWSFMVDTCERNEKGVHGHSQDMCCGSKRQLGSVGSETFAERMNSAGNLVVKENCTRLADDIIDEMIALRMNEEPIRHMKQDKTPTATFPESSQLQLKTPQSNPVI